MRMSANGRRKLKQWEGERLEAYQDQAGVWTVGVGSTTDVHAGMVITEAESDERLSRDLRTAEGAVNRLVKVPLSASQFDALVSFVFNTGTTAFANSTLLKKLNAGDYDSVPGELAKWNKITVKGRKVSNRGLSNRRAAEAGLWASGEFVASNALMPVAPAKRPVAKSKTAQGVGLTSVGTLGTALTDSAQQIQVVADYSSTLRLVFIGLLLAGIALTGYAWVKNRERLEE